MTVTRYGPITTLVSNSSGLIEQNPEGGFVRFLEYQKLQKQVARLRKRLLEKQAYEMEMLLNSGATPKFIENIKRKDALALKED